MLLLKYNTVYLYYNNVSVLASFRNYYRSGTNVNIYNYNIMIPTFYGRL